MKTGSLLLLGLLLAGCGQEEQKHIRLLSGHWDQARASSHMAAAVLEQAGYRVTVELASPGQIWARLAAGDADASLSVWMPESSAAYVTRFFDRLHDLGPNYPPLRLGLAVPADAPVHSLAELAGSGYGSGQIIGSEPSLGIMAITREVMSRYQLTHYQLQPRPVGDHHQQVLESLDTHTPVVAVAWQPDRLMLDGRLRLLADPDGAFTSGERPHTLARRGLEDSAPEAMAILDGLDWQPRDMQFIFDRLADGRDFSQAAGRWLAWREESRLPAGPAGKPGS